MRFSWSPRLSPDLDVAHARGNAELPLRCADHSVRAAAEASRRLQAGKARRTRLADLEIRLDGSGSRLGLDVDTCVFRQRDPDVPRQRRQLQCVRPGGPAHRYAHVTTVRPRARTLG